MATGTSQNMLAFFDYIGSIQVMMRVHVMMACWIKCSVHVRRAGQRLLLRLQADGVRAAVDGQEVAPAVARHTLAAG